MDKYTPNIAEINSAKFFETFGNGTRLELLNSSFEIGKLIIQLQKFNVNTNKEETRLRLYLDIDKALCLANDILSGRIAKLAQNSQNGSLTKVYQQPGGSVKDNKVIYRELSISVGKKFIIGGLECAGKRTSTGGFVSDLSNTEVEKIQINVGVDSSTLKSIALMIQSEYQAYRTAQYLMLSNKTRVEFATNY